MIQLLVILIFTDYTSPQTMTFTFVWFTEDSTYFKYNIFN